MAKTLCELKAKLKKDIKEYAKLVNQPTHLCKSCGRVANQKKFLCNPKKLKA